MNGKCPNGVKKTALLDLRNHDLPPKQAERLHRHAQSCAECSTYLAEITRYQILLRSAAMRAPYPQSRLWRDLRHQIAQGRERSNIMSLSRKAVMGSLGAVAAAVALVVVFVQVIHYLESRRSNLPYAQTTSQFTIDTSRAIKFTIPEQMSVFYVSPDGNTLIGDYFASNGNQTTTRIDSYAVSSGKLETLYAPPKGQALGDPTSDGRYLAWTQGPASNSATLNTLKVMDLQTKQITTIESKEEQPLEQGSDFVPQVAHGSVFWQDLTFDSKYGNPLSGSIKVHDLATGVTKTLTTPGLAVGVAGNNVMNVGASGNLFNVDWPYVAYTAGAQPYTDTIREEMLNVITGQVISLPLPTAAHAAPSPADIFYGLAGTMVIAGWFAVDGSMNFAQYDLSKSAHSWEPITTISDPSYTFVQDGGFEVSNRTILFSGKKGNETVTLAWDRSLHLFFTVASYVTTSTSDVQLADIFGNWLVLATYHNDPQTNDSQPTDYMMIDTRNLQLNTHG